MTLKTMAVTARDNGIGVSEMENVGAEFAEQEQHDQNLARHR